MNYEAEQQVRAIGGDAFDLRISNGKGLWTNLSQDDLRRTVQEAKASLNANQFLEIRSHGKGMQLLKDVPAEQISAAAQRGFAPAVTVEVRPGHFDVWVRHEQEMTPDVRRYVERTVRLEYGLPAVGPTNGFGAIAGYQGMEGSIRLHSSSGSTCPKAVALADELASFANDVRQRLSVAVAGAGLPQLPDFRGSNPHLSVREADLRWAELAVERGLPRTQIVTALSLQGSRAGARDPQRALRYSTRILSVALENALHLSPAAAQAMALRSAASAVALPLKILRIGLALARTAARLSF